LTPIAISIYLFFVVVSVFAIFETDITLITSDEFGWHVEENGILFLSVGLVSILAYSMISRPFVKRFDDRNAAVFGMFILIIALLIVLVWDWPFSVESKILLPQFCVASVFIAVGFPVASTFMYAIYSKILNPRFQGAKMGWLTAAGSLSRMLGPIWASNAYDIGGGQLLFTSTAMFVLVAVLVLFAFYSTLVPHPDYAKYRTKTTLPK